MTARRGEVLKSENGKTGEVVESGHVSAVLFLFLFLSSCKDERYCRSAYIHSSIFSSLYKLYLERENCNVILKAERPLSRFSLPLYPPAVPQANIFGFNPLKFPLFSILLLSSLEVWFSRVSNLCFLFLKNGGISSKFG